MQLSGGLCGGRRGDGLVSLTGLPEGQQASDRDQREQCLRPVDRPVRAYLPGDRERSQTSRRWRVGWEGTPMLTVVPDPDAGDNARPTPNSPALIDEIVREGARRMLAEALKAEV